MHERQNNRPLILFMTQTTETTDKTTENTTVAENAGNPLRYEWYLTLQSVAPEFSNEAKLEQFIDIIFRLAIGEREQALKQPLFENEPEARFQVFCTAMQQLGEAMHRRPFTDMLGEVHQLIRGKKEQNAAGSFYTPTCICDLVAAMTDKGTAAQKFAKGEVVTIADDAVGSGRLFLSFAKLYPQHLDLIRFQGSDKELNAVKMCYINCFFNKIALRIFHADTLANKVWAGYETPAWRAYESYQGIIELSDFIRKEQEMRKE